MPQRTYYLIALIFLVLSPCWASEARVDATGGLSLVLDDESAEANPYILGNPAGLALLPAQNRFDLSYAWVREEIYISGYLSHLYGSEGRFPDNPSKYHGLTFFPAAEWGIQLDADTAHTEQVPDLTTRDQTRDRLQEKALMAYNFGPFALGAQIQPIQTTTQLLPGSFPYSNAYVTSGQGGVTFLSATGGLLVNFPLSKDGKDKLWVGGTGAMGLGNNQQVENLSVTVYSPTPDSSDLTQTYTFNNLLAWGPEIYIQTDNLNILAAGRFSQFDATRQVDSSNTAAVTNIPLYDIGNQSSSGGVFAFKLKSPFGKKLFLHTGLFFSMGSADSKGLDPSGAVVLAQTDQTLNVKAGVGVEREKDFTLGLQLEATGDNTQITTGTGPLVQYFGFNVIGGAEKWMNPNWAFRMGFHYENDLNMGDKLYQTAYFPIAFKERVITPTLTVGVGFLESHFKADLGLWYGQPYLFDGPTDAFGTQYGAQVSAALIF